MACRLAEAGRFEVHVLERGRRYGRNEFPRRPEEVAGVLWDPDDGMFGPFEWRSFARSRTDAVAAAGLGGGSLIYSSVLYRIPPRFFAGWPVGITRQLLDPYYDRAATMLDGESYPVHRPDWPYWRSTPKARALLEATARIRGSCASRPSMEIEWPALAVRFGPEPGREIINRQGVAQTTCVMCGECNLGCNTHAKNTLDLNYLALAESRGALIREYCSVRSITPDVRGGFDLELADPRYRLAAQPSRRERFDIVILAAGSMGSTELALEMSRRIGLSKMVGKGVTPNGDILGFVVGSSQDLAPSRGPTITGAIHIENGSYDDGFQTAAWIEDGAIPLFLLWFYHGRLRGMRFGARALRGLLNYVRGSFGGRGGETNIGDEMAPVLFPSSAAWARNTLMLLGMGRDRAGGTYELRRAARRGYDRLHLAWNAGDGELHYHRVRTAMKRIAEALGGELIENPMDYLLNRYITVHPLGGLPLGNTHTDGAVDVSDAHLFGCANLFVVDASIIPKPIGPNPSLTIAALAEMYAERLSRRFT